MKKNHTSLIVVTVLFALLALGSQANAQTTATSASTTTTVSQPTGTSNGSGIVTPPALYNQSGAAVNAYNSSTNSLTSGWYYTQTGNPRFYYANGVYYDPASQSYGGSVLYPGANGPSIGSTGSAEAVMSGSAASSVGTTNPPTTTGFGSVSNPTTVTSGTSGSTTSSSGSASATTNSATGVMNPNGTFTPGVPNTGVGDAALFAWLALFASAAIAIAGTRYLTRNV